MLNVIIFAEGGKRLFYHDYDPRIYEFFQLDQMIGFVEAFTQVFGKAVVRENIQMILFEKTMFVFDSFTKDTEGYGDIHYTTLLISEIDRSIPFDPQEILLRRLAEQINIDFFDCFQSELGQFFKTWGNLITTFGKFRVKLDTIVKKILSDKMVKAILTVSPSNVVEAILQSLKIEK